MKRVGKPVFFVILFAILAVAYLAIFGFRTSYGDIETTWIKGINDVRWGIDIRGGVEVVFTPEEDVDATENQLDAAAEVMRQRLVSMNVTDYEVYTDAESDRIIVSFPWKAEEADFDASAAIEELGDTAVLTFREGYELDDTGLPTGVTAENIILQGADVNQAEAVYEKTSDAGSYQWVVQLTLNDSGKAAFAEATERLAAEHGIISIWMDETCISYPSVNSAILDGQAVITGSFTQESAEQLANKINGGALPFALTTENYSTITPTLGMGARNSIAVAGVIALALIFLFMLIRYRVPGLVACIGLIGQVSFTFAALTGFIYSMDSFTLTIPGICGIILGVGMGVDANIITAERIREEINSGKSIDGAVTLGYQRAFSSIIDGNITTLIVSLILMGTFGPSTSWLSQVMNVVLFMFPASTTGSIYSFGYTLLVSTLLNLLFGVLLAKYMTKSLCRFKVFRKPQLFGGER